MTEIPKAELDRYRAIEEAANDMVSAALNSGDFWGKADILKETLKPVKPETDWSKVRFGAWVKNANGQKGRVIQRTVTKSGKEILTIFLENGEEEGSVL